jgi:cytoskeletal protein CcmA (bactofilin family)
MFSKANKSGAPRSTLSILAADCRISGDIVSDGEVQIDGRLDGDVRCHVLVIGRSGLITGEVDADVVRVLGTINGHVKAGAVELAKTARVVGDIVHGSLSVETGAYVQGSFNPLPAKASEAEGGSGTPALLAAPVRPETNETLIPAVGR